MVICLERGADLHMAQLMPLPLTVSCFSKIQIANPFWYRLTRVVPDKGPLNGCVCVCVCVLPGAAAPGIDVPSSCTVLDCPFLLPIGLVDYKSLKKSICRVRLFSSRFLKQFM